MSLHSPFLWHVCKTDLCNPQFEMMDILEGMEGSCCSKIIFLMLFASSFKLLIQKNSYCSCQSCEVFKFLGRVSPSCILILNKEIILVENTLLSPCLILEFPCKKTAGTDRRNPVHYVSTSAQPWPGHCSSQRCAVLQTLLAFFSHHSH